LKKDKAIIEKEPMNDKDFMIKKLSESKIGFYNAGGSCYMASIIQILIHSKIFLDKFLSKEYKNKNSFSSTFLDFLKKLENSDKSIEIKYLANDYNYINSKFKGNTGNNPIKFFTEFIKELSKDNNEVEKIFKGKKYIKFEGMEDLNYEEDFYFLMITLDKENFDIKRSLNSEKEFEDDKNLKLSEKIIVKPNILIFNISHEGINYKFEEYINLDNDEYELKAINRYSTYHSTVFIKINKNWFHFDDSQITPCVFDTVTITKESFDDRKKDILYFKNKYLFNLFYEIKYKNKD